MGERSKTKTVEAASNEHLGSLLHDQRRKMSDLFARQQSKFHDLGERLQREIETLTEALQKELSNDLKVERDEIGARQSELTKHQDELARQQSEIEANRRELEELKNELASKRREIDADEVNLHAERESFFGAQNLFEEQRTEFEETLATNEAEKSELELERLELSKRLNEFNERVAELEAQQSAFEAEQSAFEEQRADFETRQTLVETEKSQLAADREKLEKQTKDFAEQEDKIETLRQELDAQKTEFELQRSEFETFHATIESQKAEISAQREDLTQQQSEFAIAQQQATLDLQAWSSDMSVQEEGLIQLETKLATLQAELNQRECIVESDRADLALEQEQHHRRRQRMDEQQKRLDAEFASIEKRRFETSEQRKRIADRIKAERDAQLQEIELKRHELSVLQSSSKNEAEHELKQWSNRLIEEEQSLSKLESKWNSEKDKFENDIVTLRKQLATAVESKETIDRDQKGLNAKLQEFEELAHSRATEISSLKSQLELINVSRTLESDNDREQSAEITKLREQLQELQQVQLEKEELATKLREIELNHADSEVKLAELRTLEAERDQLIEKLEAAEQKVQVAEEKLTQQAAFEEDPEKIQELKARFEMAMDDVRTLKRKNLELETQLINLRQNGSGDSGAAATSGWESMKRKMLEQLESQDNVSREERITIEKTIKQTEAIVAKKDREVHDLRELLEQQSNSVGAMAVGAAGVEAVFDHDEVIQAERERLRVAQEEWRDKLRQAEVEISLERARLARERAEVDEKLISLEAKQAKIIDTAQSGDQKGDKKESRGRWLSRLGINKENGDR